MPLWQIVLCALAYMTTGFGLGIAREWSAQSLASKEVEPGRDISAFVHFPCTFQSNHFPLLDEPTHDLPLFFDLTGGGVFYWVTIALFWPIPLAWSLLMIAFCVTFASILLGIVAMYHLVLLVRELDHMPRGVARLESTIRSCCGIE